AGGDRAEGRGARLLRAPAHPSQPRRPAVGGPGVRGRGAVGQLPADLLPRGADHGRDAAVQTLVGGLMSRLVVVSNRVAVPGQNQAGGLAVALHDALSERGGIWFGWSGRTVRGESGQLHEQEEGGIRYLTMDLSRADNDSYYNGFANRTLWPLLHFRLDLVDYTRETREGYRKVNALFADRLAPRLRDSATLGIHADHLIPRAALLREGRVGCRMGFFLHVPLPSSRLLAAMPAPSRLSSTLYAHDLVGFQSRRDVERFQDYVRLFGG